MNDLYRKYGPRGFHIVAVSDEEPGMIDNYVRNKGISYGVVSAQRVLQMFGGSGYPSSWLIGPQGNIAWEGHPAGLTGANIEPLLNLVTGSAGAPATGGGSVPAAQPSGGKWWLWLILFSVVFFVGALGWFWWSSRDRTPKLHTVLYGQQPPQGAPPQGAPPPGAPPQPGAYGAAPQQGGYGSNPQQAGYGAPQPQGGYGSNPQQQPAHGAPPQPAPGPAPQGGYLASEQHTGYSASLGNNQLKGKSTSIGGANTHGGQEQLVSNTEFRKKPKEVHYLGGEPEEEPPPPQPDPNKQPPRFQPYDPNQHRPQ